MFHFAEMDAFLNTDAQRLFDKHVLAGFNCLNGGGDVKLIGDADDHPFDLRIR
jgi:hypothetical protein